MARVLLCARGGALELAAVAGALRDRGAEPVVLDSSAYPSGLAMTLACGRDGFRGTWGGPDAEPASPRAGDLSGPREISAVWQSAVVGTQLPAMAPGMRETCVAASERTLAGLLDGLGAFQLDPVWNQLRADHKPLQLRRAQRLGLEVPETIITNDPAAVRAFARRCGPLVTKMLVQPAGSGGEPEGEAEVVFTTALSDSDLEQLDGLDLCPMIFQQRIANQRDVRATVVGRRVFGAALDAAARDAGPGARRESGESGDPVDPDWRRESYALDRAPAWAPCELPRALTDRLLRLLDELGLNYAAVDLIARPDGGYVFLELNATGSFGFLGAELAGPIAAAIAEVLVDPAARRVASEV